MNQRITLHFGQGDFSQGYTVVAQIWLADASMPIQITGSLLAEPELGLLYRRWQWLYTALYAYRGWRNFAQIESPMLRGAADEFEIETDETYPTDVSEVAFKQVCDQLHQTLNRWLNSEGFRNIDRHLRTSFTPQDELQLIVMAEDRHLLRLPWHLWHFFEDYPNAELALSLPEYQRSLKVAPSQPKETINILAVLGNSQGIDIENDKKLLETLPNTQLSLLSEPRLTELNQQLWETHWDILFFAGHSSGSRQQETENGDKNLGKFHVNATESLTIEQLKFALKKAIQKGLKLAIFNSCDGLDLAWNLADLQIPQVIVMREPVPDRVAQEFLKHFLAAFSTGQSLFLAVREAREKLQGLETEFLCASWLPVICQNPAELPMRWELDVREDRDNGEEGSFELAGLSSKFNESIQPSKLKTQNFPKFKTQNFNSKLIKVLLTSLFTTVCLLGVRSLGGLQPLELWVYDRLLQLRPEEAPDNRFLIVTIDEADIQAQPAEQRQGSLSDNALDQLLKILNNYQARVIGLDIYRDFSANSKYPSLITQLRQQKRLVAICKSSDATFDPTGIAPPPEVPASRIGFSDFLEDNDGIIRRQLLSQTPDPASPCAAPYAFNTRLAFRYLEMENISPEFTPEGNLKLGQTIIQRLQKHSGGYQTIDAAGNQILLNYRSLPSLQAIAPQVSLSQILQGKVRPEAIKDRIVLVGVTATSSSDFWTTPYGSGTADKIPGVIIQAHMTSQLISAVLDQRSLIWVWSEFVEIVWIGSWAIMGGICASMRLSLVQIGILSSGAIAVLIGSCWFLFIQGGWIPCVSAGVAFVGTVGIVRYLNQRAAKSKNERVLDR